MSPQEAADIDDGDKGKKAKKVKKASEAGEVEQDILMDQSEPLTKDDDDNAVSWHAHFSYDTSVLFALHKK